MMDATKWRHAEMILFPKGDPVLQRLKKPIEIEADRIEVLSLLASETNDRQEVLCEHL